MNDLCLAVALAAAMATGTCQQQVIEHMKTANQALSEKITALEKQIKFLESALDDARAETDCCYQPELIDK